MHRASTQELPLPQSVCTAHCGAASPGVSQKPPGPQTVMVVQVQQSALLRQLLRQLPSTQSLSLPQSLLLRQVACGRSSG